MITIAERPLSEQPFASNKTPSFDDLTLIENCYGRDVSLRGPMAGSQICGNFNFSRAYISGMQRDRELSAMKRRVPSSNRIIVAAATGLVLWVATFAYAGDRTGANALRHVKGTTVISDQSPKVQLSVPKGFRFIGSQQVNLYGNADADQYLFAKLAADNTVDRFYWMQFEHFLPTNDRTYNNASMRITQIENLRFNYDVKSLPDFAALLTGDPGSDGAAMGRLLAKRHLLFPHKAVMVRMFHLPSADRRTELMIIYGEALPQGTAVPVREGGVSLDSESPASAPLFLQHAREGLSVQTR
jgi:hypothetical protein